MAWENVNKWVLWSFLLFLHKKQEWDVVLRGSSCAHVFQLPSLQFASVIMFYAATFNTLHCRFLAFSWTCIIQGAVEKSDGFQNEITQWGFTFLCKSFYRWKLSTCHFKSWNVVHSDVSDHFSITAPVLLQDFPSPDESSAPGSPRVLPLCFALVPLWF